MVRRLAVAAALVLAACEQRPPATAPSAPAARVVTPSAPQVVAAAPTLAFLPPLGTGVPDPATFNASAAPTVEICAWNGVACAAPPIVSFSTTPSGSTLPIVVDAAAGRYDASWNLLDARFTSRQTYRIRVLQGTTQLGAVSVDVVRGRWALTRSDGTLAPLVSAAVLPIGFTLSTTTTNQPPVARITSPTPNASFTQGQPVLFSGSAADPEDGALTGASLVWTSSRDGQIGTGTSFSVGTLSVGTHVITLTATDGMGATGTATVTIKVTQPTGPGPLTNGATATGRIAAAGQVDRWTFTATAGAHAVISLGETGTTSGFEPGLSVLDPNGGVVASNFGFSAAQVEFSASATGSYTVIVGSAGGGFTGTGDYLITLVRAPESLTVSAGDQGGALAHGVTQTGTIYQGDVDAWTFTATQGGLVVLDLAETLNSSGFSPWLRVIGPTGTVIARNFGFTAAHVQFLAPSTGTYTVVVGSAGGGFTGNGDYTLVLTP